MNYIPMLINSPQLGGDFNGHKNLPQAGVNSDSPVFHIPWGHNKLIIDKCKGDKDKALFFVKESLSNNWSRAVLMNFLDTNCKAEAVTIDKFLQTDEALDMFPHTDEVKKRAVQTSQRMWRR